MILCDLASFSKPARKRAPVSWHWLEAFLVDHIEHGETRRERHRIPPKVLKWSFWLSERAMSIRVVTAARGTPLPMPLAIVTISGVMS